MAAHQDRCDIGPCEGKRKGFAGRQRLRTEALQPGTNHPTLRELTDNA